ncbi:class I SAM-dependent methyltransferase [uncultured Clostridium sp.]|uniref:class I SAM-dependent methyltransferase n=1 Tax=uncultured Clostridium sp. TaxID=59620 RepID=UPI0028F14F86|nr:class I SAM-dependent methyltransferase [uncultured Clostridium sp.]
MNDREFFNNLASKWDEICNHDDKKLREIMKLSKMRENSKVLDVGTGTGVLVKYLLEYSPIAIKAVDLSENMIEVARNKYNNDNVEFIVKDIMDFQEGNFNYIFLYSVYPHFMDKDELFGHLYKLLKVDGKIVIAHSESKEKINNIHKKSDTVKEHMLPAVEVTSNIMSKYFKVEEAIDNENMYYISGIKIKGGELKVES